MRRWRAAIRNYETAYRMQAAVPELCDIRGETEATKQLYGLDSKSPDVAAYGRQCLVARRLVERGVRFVELSCLTNGIGAGGAPEPVGPALARSRKATARWPGRSINRSRGLIRDLKSRGGPLGLDPHRLGRRVWGGRPSPKAATAGTTTPTASASGWPAGGVKGGTTYGATDDLGYYAVEKVTTTYDLYATMLHLLGLDHEKLTYRYGGRDFRLTDVHGHVLKELLA